MPVGLTRGTMRKQRDGIMVRFDQNRSMIQRQNAILDSGKIALLV
jgi:hypothetical protein